MSNARAVTRGGRLLRKYLKDTSQSVPGFCEAHGLERIQVQRVLNGDRTRISVDFAEAIQTATEGAVPWNAWSKKTLRPVGSPSPDSHPPAAA